MYEERLESVVGTEFCERMGFNSFAVIAGYRPWFPVGNIDPKVEFVIDPDKKTFWNKMQAKYPGSDEMPKFMGAIRTNFFLGLKDDKFVYVGQ